jgi:hypothetical protein
MDFFYVELCTPRIEGYFSLCSFYNGLHDLTSILKFVKADFRYKYFNFECLERYEYSFSCYRFTNQSQRLKTFSQVILGFKNCGLKIVLPSMCFHMLKPISEAILKLDLCEFRSV